VLEISRLSKEYPTPGGSLVVLSDVSLTLAAGDAAAITGPSGSGKSSLLYLLGGLEPPTSGTVALAGQDPYSLTPAALAEFRNREIGFVFQDHCLLPQLSVLENVLVPTLVARTDRDAAAESLAFARGLIERVGLAGRIDHRPAELSGGEKQRVVIAGALAQSPEILLLDEPTASLDLAYQLEIRSILHDLNRNRNLTIVVSTHDLNFAASLCRELVLLHQGRVLAAGPTAAMLEPSLIRQLYGVEVDITSNARTGQLTVIPVARSAQLPRP